MFLAAVWDLFFLNELICVSRHFRPPSISAAQVEGNTHTKMQFGVYV